jgi:hypothetical protein
MTCITRKTEILDLHSNRRHTRGSKMSEDQKTDVSKESALDVLEHFKRMLLRNTYTLLVVAFLIVMLSYSLTRISINSPLSYVLVFAVVITLLGQVLLLGPFGFSHPFYVFSFVEANFISLLIWLPNHISNSELGVPIYFGVAALLIAIPFAIHWVTKKKNGIFSLIPIFSIFLFGLLIILSNAQNVSITSFDMLFLLTVVLFALTSVLGMNMTYRTLMLNRELKIRDRNHYLRKTKEDLLGKYKAPDAEPDIDLLLYYLSSSLESFVYGDLDRSFMDAFKIIDNKGTAFKTIYTLQLDEKQWKHLKDIRDRLSHARIRQNKKEEEKEMLQTLKELRKTLFQETLEVLKIVQFKFIGVALEDREPKTQKS